MSYPLFVFALTGLALTWYGVSVITDDIATPPNSSTQTVGLYARSWKLVSGDYEAQPSDGQMLGHYITKGHVATFFRDGLTSDNLDATGHYSEGLFGSKRWLAVEGTDGPNSLRLFTEFGPRNADFRYLVKHLDTESLTLELLKNGTPTGKTLVFAGQPRVPRTKPGQAPFWLLVSIQTTAALIAHRFARTGRTSVVRCLRYIAIHTGIGSVLSLTLFAFRPDGFFGHMAVWVSISFGLVCGFLGGLVHLASRRKEVPPLPLD